MTDFNSLKKLIFISLGIYFVVSLATRALPPEMQKNIIPFFSWFLYVRVPNNTMTYVIRIHKYHEQVFDPPVYFHQAKFLKEHQSGKARQLIQHLGTSVTNGEAIQIQNLRLLFERAYLTAPSSYEIGQLWYNPLKRWTEGYGEYRKLLEFKATNQ